MEDRWKMFSELRGEDVLYPRMPPACCVECLSCDIAVAPSWKADWNSTQQAFCMIILNYIWSECETLQMFSWFLKCFEAESNLCITTPNSE